MRRLHGYLPRLSFDVILDLFAVLQLLLQLFDCILHITKGEVTCSTSEYAAHDRTLFTLTAKDDRELLRCSALLHLGLQEKPPALFQLAIPLSQESLRHDHSLGRNQCSVLGIKTCSR